MTYKRTVALSLAMILMVIPFLLARAVAHIIFMRGCGDYLKRAADSNTIPLAQENLKLAIDYALANDLTTGFTSVIYRTPDEDVGFWFSNLEASLAELSGVPSSASPLERSNVLMKLRETLTDQGKDGVSVTVPDGISVYPNNGKFMAWGWLSLVSLVFGVWILMKETA